MTPERFAALASLLGRLGAPAMVIGGVALPIISATDLLNHKILAGRPRDMEDAESIALRQGDRVDRRFVRGTLLERAALLDDDDVRRRVDEILPADPPNR
jgi:hypothetical protein